METIKQAIYETAAANVEALEDMHVHAFSQVLVTVACIHHFTKTTTTV